MVGLYIVLALVIFMPALALVAIEAAPLHTSISISNTCKALLVSNSSTNCPSYQELLILFPDQSDQSISGAFGFSENGFYERQQTKMKNHARFYKFHEDPILWIDPPPPISEQGQRIIIAANNFDYPIKDQEITNASFKVGQNRYVSSTCSYAIISAADFIFLLGDTLNLLSHNCDRSYSNFNDTKTITWNATYHDISQTAKWKLDQWIKSGNITDYRKAVYER